MFFAPSRFSFTELLSRHWQAVLAECDALPKHEFDAWPETALYNRGWDVYGLYLMSRPLLENCVFCPQTVALLRIIPGLRTALRPVPKSHRMSAIPTKYSACISPCARRAIAACGSVLGRSAGCPDAA
jgi:Aspartyl/Asparaginyl beta-hydroxylase